MFQEYESLKEAMKKHNINLDSSSFNYSSHGHAIFSSIFFNAKYTSSTKWVTSFWSILSYGLG